MMNIAVFASGRGSNFAAIVRAVKKGTLKANIALLVCDQPQAKVIRKAKRYAIPVFLIKRENFPTREDFEKRILQELKKYSIDLIVLAGFMRLIGKVLLNQYPGRILNIHPALLPAFKGTYAIEDAFNYGVKVTGVTVHFVDDKMDHGPIILQEAIKIKETDTLETLEAKIHAVEHKLYPKAIQLFLENKLSILGRKVKISN
ncbi:MAG: phosphoribosylglycinamide formyltransferase [Candidatus Omnitrophica bacterium]|nr:phosphoribosylglycinamide formyltransferase [Candidatus Omnitrophota bacterium]